MARAKTEVVINDDDQDSDIEIVLTNAQAAAVLRAVVNGSLKVNLLTDSPIGNGKTSEKFDYAT